MKSITIHKLDDQVSRLLEERAKRQNMSLNQVIKGILRSALGLNEQTLPDYQGEFEDLFGTWSDEEAAAFEARVAELDVIDASEW